VTTYKVIHKDYLGLSVRFDATSYEEAARETGIRFRAVIGKEMREGSRLIIKDLRKRKQKKITYHMKG
jgi:histidyl-tRNA synthetase